MLKLNDWKYFRDLVKTCEYCNGLGTIGLGPYDKCWTCNKTGLVVSEKGQELLDFFNLFADNTELIRDLKSYIENLKPNDYYD